MAAEEKEKCGRLIGARFAVMSFLNSHICAKGCSDIRNTFHR